MTEKARRQSRPLDGVRVVDFTRVLSGPFSTALMADLGAEVIKIESSRGDDYRHVPPFRETESAFFLLINRGKKSLVLNLKSDEGRSLAHDLIRESDVVVENFRPGVARRLSIDYETCRRLREDIIYASISGFGQSGEMSDRPAYDIIVQAASGLMHSTGFAENSPTLVGEAMGDLVAGVFAAWGVSSALFERERTGRGRFLDVSMFDCLFSVLPTSIAQWSYGGHLPRRTGNRHPISVPFGTYQAADGYFVLAILNNELFDHFLTVIGKAHLIGDQRFASDATRSDNEPAVRHLVESWAADKTVESIVSLFSDERIPAGPIWTIEQAVNSAQVRERGLLARVPHKTAGEALVLEQPIRFDGMQRGELAPPPLLGEHSAEILKSLCGVSQDRLDDLRTRGIVATGHRDG